MTRQIWIKTLRHQVETGTPNEKRLASLALELIIRGGTWVDPILDRTASEILES